MNLVILAAGAVVTAIIYWYRWRVRNKRLVELAEQFPGPRSLPILGNALLFLCKPEDVVHVIQKILVKYGSWSRFWLGPDLNLIINDPDDIKLLLNSPKMNYKGPQYKYMADMLGGGLLSGSGPIWRKHRKTISPNFGKKALVQYENLFNVEVGTMLSTCRQIPSNEAVNIYKYVVQTTSYAVCQTMMGLSKEQTMSLPYLQKVIEDSPGLYAVVFERMTRWWFQIDPIFWLTNAHRRQEDFRHVMNTFCNAIIEYRKDNLRSMKIEDLESTESFNDGDLSAVDRFLLSKDLSNDDLIKETFTIFTASQEASAKIASALILMMAYHPHCQERLYEEIVSIMGEEDRHITEDDLKKMDYLEMAFKEIIRLFPIGAMLQRTVSEDIAISKGTLPSGCSLTVPIYHLHRDPRFWEKPNSFDPDRFSPENTKRRPSNCYIPFSLGPMDCIGRYFGTKLVKTICVRFLREFKVAAIGNYDTMKINIAISASPLNGYNVFVAPRIKLNRV